jgi:hypothetical protein
MSNPDSPVQNAEWKNLLDEPHLASHMGRLLKLYRETLPETRNQVILAELEKINSAANVSAASPTVRREREEQPRPVATEAPVTPPFKPDSFTPPAATDRRQSQRMKCFVAVEMRIPGAAGPAWGTLSDASLGGCFVETTAPLENKIHLEIGLWVAEGKIWVKGVTLNGVVTRSKPCLGVRIKFTGLDTEERKALRQFMRSVEAATKQYHHERGYLARLHP